MPLNILLNGAKGRMGQTITSFAHAFDTTIQSATDANDDPLPHIPDCDAIVDFSSHEATLPLAQAATRHKKPMVIGTTGHSTKELQAITCLAQEIPIVLATNFSIGVNLLFYLTHKAATALNQTYHPEILESHHCHKKDAPSGTAKTLLNTILKARNIPQDNVRHGRDGFTGERPDNQVGIHAIRGGDIVGEHTVLFAGPGERLELSHKASDRKIYAQGALHATHWIINQKPGLYSMLDVLDLNY